MVRVFHFAQRVILCVGALLIVTATLSAQEAPETPLPPSPQFGVPEDWSTQHVIYTLNGSVEDMMAVRGDPRFLNSFLLHNMREHRNQVQQALGTELNLGLNSAESIGSRNGAPTSGLQPQNPGNDPITFPDSPRKNKRSKVDWAMSLG